MSNNYNNANEKAGYVNAGYSNDAPVYPQSGYNPANPQGGFSAQPQQTFIAVPPPPPPPLVKAPGSYIPGDVEQGGQSGSKDRWGNFTNLNSIETRMGFIRKVYAILSLQLIFTFGVVCIFVFVEPVKVFAKTNTGLYLYIASYIVFLTLIITMSCLQCVKGLRTVPWNYLLLAGLTASMTYMLSMISAYHEVQAVLIAIGVTLFVVIGVTLFSIQTKYDLTNCWMVMLCLTLGFIGFGIAVGVAARYNIVMQGVYGGLGAVLMSLFLAIDTQLLIGGKRKFQFDPEDYINAALQLYIDICYIFLYILSAVGGKK